MNPFGLNKTKRKLYIPDMECFAYLFFVPLVFKFMLWLLSEAKNADLDTICFVARDGYILRLLYEKVEKYYGINGLNCIYFLTSRRACSVTNIKNKEDVFFIIDNLCNVNSLSV